MKKIQSLTLLLLFATGILAQNIAQKIPATANIVGSIDAGKINKLMPVEEWEKTSLGKKFKEMQAKDSSLTYNSIKDFGIDLSGTLYYFHTEDDSMHYNTVLVPLTDATKLDKVLANKGLARLAGDTRKITDDDSTGYFMWNNEQLVYVKALIKEGYFRNAEVAARHGLSYSTPVSYSDANDVTVVSVDTAQDLKEEYAVPDSVLAFMDTAVINYNNADETDSSSFTYYEPNENDFDYYNDLKIKKRLAAASADSAVNKVFYTNPVTSILSNEGFLKNYNANAIANIWVDKPMSFYANLLPGYLMGKTSSMSLANAFPEVDAGYNSFSASLLIDEKQMNIHTQMEMTNEMAAMQEKIFDRKLNKQFYKYINTDSMLGYMTWAVNTKAYLEQFPAMMERTYGNMGLGIGRDETSLAAEFISLLLDEEAIGNMIKGDAMVIFDGVYQQETTYTDYTYDENFKSTEVQKTKTETLPRFLMMLSSEENNLVRKLINYGIKQSVVKAAEGFYEIEVPKSPVHFYFMNKDGVFFLTNSLLNIQQISTGSFKANLSKQEKKFMANHNFTMLINPKNISGKIAQTDLGATESLTNMMNTFNKMGMVRMKVNALQNNTTSADLWMETPAGNTNALTHFFTLFEDMLK
ncbi:MAG: hypothetical protein H7X88_01930 [Gloeobacteraceae cyanobacterium ES-bin-316]|nr:hypothetical protein [Ferruginibacter sp.]